MTVFKKSVCSVTKGLSKIIKHGLLARMFGLMVPLRSTGTSSTIGKFKMRRVFPRNYGMQYREVSNSSKRKQLCHFSPEMEKVLKCRKDVKLEVCLVDDFLLDPNHCPPKVVIVGAGLAGLSAAHRLTSCGVTDVTVIEALDRPGGRIHSCWLDEAVVELGAQWIEGACAANPVFNLACQEGLVKDPMFRQDLRRGMHMTSKGEDLSLLVDATAYHSFRLIEEQAADLYSHTESEDVGDLESFIRRRIPQELAVYPEDYRSKAALAMYGMTQELRSYIGDDLCRVSANQFGSNYGPPGGNVKVPSGMIGILAPLIRELPPCNIKYCKPVDTVVWSPQEVKVKCCDGDVFCPDYCIVTVSLGVLKAKHEKMFSPNLPEDKQEAIKKLGYGHINTVYVDYPRPFWVWQEGNIRLAWSMEELCETKEDWARNMGVIEEMPTSSQVLMVNVAGKDAAELVEKKTEACIAEDLTRTYRRFLGDPTLPYPSNVIRSKWTGSKFFEGAKSYIPVGSSVADQCTLACPIPEECGKDVPRVMFAGEATCPGHHGTLQGARISGVREAERILRLTKKLCGLPPRVEDEVVEKKTCR